jgi:hypothetical protein
MRVKLFMLLLVVLAGCDDQAREDIQWTRTQADKSQQDASQAHETLKHVQTLRDVDRMRYEEDLNTTKAEVTVWRTLLICLSVLFVMVLAWLAREIRLRRVLSQILLARREPGEVKNE